MRADGEAENGCAIVHVDNRSDQSATSDQATRARVAPSVRAEAVLALTTMAFSNSQARRAVDDAVEDDPGSLEELVRSALRRCARL